MQTILSIDRGEEDTFCIMRGNQIIYLGTNTAEVRKYRIDVVVVDEPLSLEQLKEMLDKEKI